jgi:hypothetical protein
VAKESEKRRTAVRRSEARATRKVKQRSRTKRRKFVYFVGSGIFAVAIIVGLFLPSLPIGNLGTSTGTASYADGIGIPQPVMPSAYHVDGKTVSYSTLPPTSGDHWSAPAQCGFYDSKELADEVIVHNMEHGNVVINYNISDESQKSHLKELHSQLSGSNEWLVTRPYKEIPEGSITLTAWGISDEFEGVNEERITRFVETYSGNLFSDETKRLNRGIPCSNIDSMAK